MFGKSVVDPAKYYFNNVAGSQVLLDAMRAAGIGNLVFSSTCAIYGTPDEVPIRKGRISDRSIPMGAAS